MYNKNENGSKSYLFFFRWPCIVDDLDCYRFLHIMSRNSLPQYSFRFVALCGGNQSPPFRQQSVTGFLKPEWQTTWQLGGSRNASAIATVCLSVCVVCSAGNDGVCTSCGGSLLVVFLLIREGVDRIYGRRRHMREFLHLVWVTCDRTVVHTCHLSGL